MKVTATFSNGQKISRFTIKNLAYAYRSVNIYQEFTGFATTKELALKAAKQTGKNKAISIEVVEVLVGE
jgi:hypothetical protein